MRFQKVPSGVKSSNLFMISVLLFLLFFYSVIFVHMKLMRYISHMYKDFYQEYMRNIYILKTKAISLQLIII